MLSLSNKIAKVKEKLKPIENDVILVVVIILVAFISFGLGRLSKIGENKTPITIESATEVQPPTNLEAKLPSNKPTSGVGASTNSDKLYVASKSGTKYHYPWCPGALNIKEENKIWFSSKEEAESAGYSPAANCKGL